MASEFSGLFAWGALALASAVIVVAYRPQWVVRNSGLVLGALALATLVALSMIVSVAPPGFRIRLDPSTEPLLPTSDPGRDAYAQAMLEFGNDDLYVVAMETDEGVFSADNLAALRRVTDGIHRLPHVREAESLTQTIDFRFDPEIGGPSVARFIGRKLPSSEAELAAARARALANPLYRKTLLSADGRTAGINVGFQPLTDQEFIDAGIEESVTAILAAERTPTRRFFITGRPHIRAAGHALMVNDLVLLIPLAVIVAAFSLFVMTGSIRGTLISLTTCLVATVWSFGAMGALGIDMNLITLVLGPMLICVGSVYGVYSFERYELIAQQESDRQRAAIATLEYIRLPMFVAASTTIVGFGVFLLADVRATNELGMFSVFGIGAVWLIGITGVPSALALVGPPSRLTSPPRNPVATLFRQGIERLLARLGWLVGARPGTVLMVWAVFLTGALGLLPSINVDTDFLSFFPEGSPVRTDFAAINRVLVGSVPIYVTFETGREGAFREPTALAALDAVRAELVELDGVDRVLSAVEMISTVNAALEGGEPTLPETREGVAEAIFTIPKARLGRFLNANQSGANLILRTDRLGSRRVRELENGVRAVVARHPIASDVQVAVTGSAILVNRSADGIAGNQLAQIGAAALTIVVLIGSALRSWRIGLLAIVPNVAPVVLLFGVLGTQIAPLSLATGLIGSMALGIAVDDTVHFLVSYRHGRERGLTPEEAAAETLRTTGRAIVLTSIMLVIGFLIVLNSSFATLRDFAYLSALTIGFCLASDLTLTPALLVKAKI